MIFSMHMLLFSFFFFNFSIVKSRTFNGIDAIFTVPYIYPVDLFARNWAVDRLQRLGVSRYFRDEINQCMEYVYR